MCSQIDDVDYYCCCCCLKRRHYGTFNNSRALLTVISSNHRESYAWTITDGCRAVCGTTCGCGCVWLRVWIRVVVCDADCIAICHRSFRGWCCASAHPVCWLDRHHSCYVSSSTLCTLYIVALHVVHDGSINCILRVVTAAVHQVYRVCFLPPM